VTDTPGLLNRVDADRNSMERLTLASVAHLPTAVLFVTDLTGLCGTKAEEQFAIRDTLKKEFPGTCY
jgi:nucleolar GTP-binding protein